MCYTQLSLLNLMWKKKKFSYMVLTLIWLNLYSIYFPFLNYSIKLTNYNSDPDIKFTYKWTWICYGCQLWRLIRKKKKSNYLVRNLFYHWLCNTPFSVLHNWYCISFLFLFCLNLSFFVFVFVFAKFPCLLLLPLDWISGIGLYFSLFLCMQFLLDFNKYVFNMEIETIN